MIISFPLSILSTLFVNSSTNSFVYFRCSIRNVDGWFVIFRRPFKWNASRDFLTFEFSETVSSPYISLLRMTALYTISFCFIDESPCFQNKCILLSVIAQSCLRLATSMVGSPLLLSKHPRHLTSDLCWYTFVVLEMYYCVGVEVEDLTSCFVYFHAVLGSFYFDCF